MNNKKGCGCGKKNTTDSVVSSTPNLPTPGDKQINAGYINYPVPHTVINTNSERHPKVEPEVVQQETGPMKFKERQVESPTNLKEQITKKLGMVQSFATAIASRGLSNAKINKPIKQLRVLSCLGNQAQGGELPPCEYLRDSTVLPGKKFCGGCGCGDKPHTWLLADGEQYSKLDYPRLNCPLKMPGFTNYESSKPEEQGPPPTRRHYIENINYSEIEKITVTLPEMERPPSQNQ